MSFSAEPPQFQTTDNNPLLATEVSWISMPVEAIARVEFIAIATDHNNGHAIWYFEFVARRTSGGAVQLPSALVGKVPRKSPAATAWDANPIVVPTSQHQIGIQVTGGLGQTVSWAVFPLSCAAMTDFFIPPP